jgi:hypothetical protein
MTLTVTMDGTKANIQADSFSFDVTMSGSQALISTPSAQAEVTFADPRASIKWLARANNVCSSFMNNLGPIYDPIVLSSYASGWTMGAAETLVEYYSHDLTATSDRYEDLGFYGSYLFYISKSGSTNRVYIDGTSSVLAGSLFCDPDYTYVGNMRFSVMSEMIVYVLYYFNDSVTKEVRLAKLDYETDTRTLVDSWEVDVSYDGDTKSYWETPWMVRALYGEKDYLVAVTQWLGDTGNALMRILVWDTVNETQVAFDWNYVMNSEDYIEFADEDFVTRPSMYQGKVIFTCFPNNYDDTSTTALPWPSFIVDLADDSITKIGGSRTGTVASPNVQGSGLDQSTGIYYVFISNNDETAFPHDILKIDLNDASPNYATFRSGSDEGTIIMGESQAWAAKYLTSPNRFAIYGPLPDYSAQATTATDSTLFVDEANNVAWQLADDYNSINGYELSGGADKSITLTWGGDKFKYASSQAVYPLLMFDGLFVVVVYSYQPSPAAYQRELVIFGV